MNTEKELSLLPHNLVPYQRMVESIRTNSRCYIEHPTGAGKSYIIGYYIMEHPNKAYLYLTNSKELVIDFEEKILHKHNFNSQIKTGTYSKIPINMRKLDVIFLDELHSCGAYRAEKMIRSLLNNNPQATVIGVSATVIRYLDKRRNMGIQLCHGNLASRYTMTDAFRDHALEEPYYSVCIIKNDFLRCIDETPVSISDIISFNQITNMKTIFKMCLKYWDGKYIVYVPNITSLRDCVLNCKEYFSFIPYDIACYWEYYADPGNENNYSSFIKDETKRLRLFFCIEKYTHGIHPDIDGVILMRQTNSLNLFEQMIGRCLKYHPKRRPQIIDVFNNIDHFAKVKHFPKESSSLFLQSDSVADMYEDNSIEPKCTLSVKNISLSDFFITMNHILRNQISWRDAYTLAKRYSECHGGKLDCPRYYLTPEGFPLGEWVEEQRIKYYSNSRNHLSQTQIDLLNAIGIIWGFPDHEEWMKNFRDAQCIYGSKSLNIPPSVKNWKKKKVKFINAWIDEQYLKKNGIIKPALVDEQIQLIQDLYYEWNNTYIGKWKRNIDTITKFYFRNGIVHISVSENKYLYRWWQNQLRIFNNEDTKYVLLPFQRKIMEELGASRTLHVIFQENLQLCLDYLQEHSSLQEIFYNQTDPVCKHLASWLRYLHNRDVANKLSQLEKETLAANGIDLHTLHLRSRYSHDKILHAATKYFALYGNTRFPRDYLIDGIPIYKCIYNLKNKQGRTLSPEIIEKFAKIGIVFTEDNPS